MRVTFERYEEKGRRACRWTAVTGSPRIPRWSHMGVGDDIPHDLAQYVVEAATGTTTGFWGTQARGATFKRTGRKVTKAGRKPIVEHRGDIEHAEHLAHVHWAAWKAGEQTPVTAALDAAFRRWCALRPGESMVFEWPASSPSE